MEDDEKAEQPAKRPWWRKLWDLIRRPDTEEEKEFGQEW